MAIFSDCRQKSSEIYGFRIMLEMLEGLIFKAFSKNKIKGL